MQVRCIETINTLKATTVIYQESWLSFIYEAKQFFKRGPDWKLYLGLVSISIIPLLPLLFDYISRGFLKFNDLIVGLLDASRLFLMLYPRV